MKSGGFNVTKRWLFNGKTEKKEAVCTWDCCPCQGHMNMSGYTQTEKSPYRRLNWEDFHSNAAAATTTWRALSLSLIRLMLRNSESWTCSVPLPSQAFSNSPEANTANPWPPSSIFISVHLQAGSFHPLWPAYEHAQSPRTYAHFVLSSVSLLHFANP